MSNPWETTRYGRPPAELQYLIPTLTALSTELRVAVAAPHAGLRKTESQWPIFQLNWQRTRYVYDMYCIYHKIGKEVYDYCVRSNIVDSSLIAKWKKPGYELLCSTYVITPSNYKFGGVSICRVPFNKRKKDETGNIEEITDATTGCRGCASGGGGGRGGNIFGGKYGQRLAGIQIARERRVERARMREEEEQAKGSGGGGGEEETDSEDEGPALPPSNNNAGESDTDSDEEGPSLPQQQPTSRGAGDSDTDSDSDDEGPKPPQVNVWGDDQEVREEEELRNEFEGGEGGKRAKDGEAGGSKKKAKR